MKLLALDTAGPRCSVALLQDGKLTELAAVADKVQGETVLPLVERLLAEAGLTLHSLDALAFGRGPGAFTGLRVAASVVQGLAFGAGLPVVPVSNLTALAAAVQRLHGPRQVMVCLDARMQEVYWAAFSADPEDPRPLSPERLSLPSEVEAPSAGAWFGAGSGWAAYGEALKARIRGLDGIDGLVAASAANIVSLAEKAFKRGETVPPERAIPVYLRDNVATPKI